LYVSLGGLQAESQKKGKEPLENFAIQNIRSVRKPILEEKCTQNDEKLRKTMWILGYDMNVT